MKLMSFTHDGRRSIGLVEGDDVIDLTDAAGTADVVDVFGDGGWERVMSARGRARGGFPLTSVEIDLPVGRPGKIFCIGVNYGGRNSEYRDGTEAPVHPSVFVRFPSSFAPHGRPLVRPPESGELDYEGEIVAVIGRRGRRIPAGRARQHIAGLTLGNEGTIRDWVRHGKFNVTQGKNWDRSGSIGPWIVPVDPMAGFGSLRVTTRVNGEVRQDDVVSSMAFPIETQIEYLSTFCTLEPGDLIFTGTPTGSGARLDPPRFLQPGDVVEVEVPEIGILRNGVVDEAWAEAEA